MSVNRLLAALVAELEAGDVPDPCGQRFTLAAAVLDARVTPPTVRRRLPQAAD